MLALAEAMREHAWRMLLDWPDLMGREPAVGVLQAIVQTLTKLPQDLCPEGVCWRLGGELGPKAPETTLALLDDLDRLLERELLDASVSLRQISDNRLFQGAMSWLWETIRAQDLEGLGASAVAPLPALPLPELNTMLAQDENDEVVTRPTWRGGVHETGPLARMCSRAPVAALINRHGSGLLARLAARLLELLELPTMMRGRWRDEPGSWRVEAFSPAPGIGLAVVETARGRLAHRVELSGDRVRRYQVLAPTEWNFHPEGPLVCGLINLSAEDRATLRRHATMTVMALDPCVGYRVNVV
jgi:hypothetical protein